MVVLKQRQYFELACPQCSFENLIESDDGQVHCPNCFWSGWPGDCSVVSVQTEIVEEADTGITVLSGHVTLTPGHVYEIATTPMRCPFCGALGVEAANETVGACFACYSAVVLEEMVIDSRDTEQSWMTVAISQERRTPVAIPVAG
ncbi:MAG: hypothetical protein GXY82_09230 [Methanospirillum sp.]|nr:hypothetical protein [Methanospirillum sp.]